MVVMILERVPRSLRGELTRWLLEIDTGVFIGRVSALVRDLLWQKLTTRAGAGRCALVHSADNEQGFAVRLHGFTDRGVADFDGLSLISVQTAEAKEKLRHLESREPRSQ